MSAAGRPWRAGAAPPPRLGPLQAAGSGGSGASAPSGRSATPGGERWLSAVPSAVLYATLSAVLSAVLAAGLSAVGSVPQIAGVKPVCAAAPHADKG